MLRFGAVASSLSDRCAARRVETIDALGRIVTPGFVDIHTHYDGQVTWDPLLEPTTLHGVTTLVMGNCGVGFAPVRPGSEEWLIQLMEGVEDIPGAALAEGMRWEWESFPEYLDVLARKPLAVDVGTQIPHGAVRAYVMGERGARNEAATPTTSPRCADIVAEAIEAGALGFSTSRTLVHRAKDGVPVPGTFADEAELFGIAEALRDAGEGMYEVVPLGVVGEDLDAPMREMDMMHRLAEFTRRPVTFALVQIDARPELWRDQLAASAARSTPDCGCIRRWPRGRRASLAGCSRQPVRRPAELRRAACPAVGGTGCRDAQASSPQGHPRAKHRLLAILCLRIWPPRWTSMYVVGDPADYEPAADRSVAAIAAASGVDPYVQALRLAA